MSVVGEQVWGCNEVQCNIPLSVTDKGTTMGKRCISKQHSKNLQHDRSLLQVSIKVKVCRWKDKNPWGYSRLFTICAISLCILKKKKKKFLSVVLNFFHFNGKQAFKCIMSNSEYTVLTPGLYPSDFFIPDIKRFDWFQPVEMQQGTSVKM